MDVFVRRVAGGEGRSVQMDGEDMREWSRIFALGYFLAEGNDTTDKHVHISPDSRLHRELILVESEFLSANN